MRALWKKTYILPTSRWPEVTGRNSGRVVTAEQLKMASPGAASRQALPIRQGYDCFAQIKEWKKKSQEQDNAVMQPAMKAKNCLDRAMRRKTKVGRKAVRSPLIQKRPHINLARSTAGYRRSHFPVNTSTLVKGEG